MSLNAYESAQLVRWGPGQTKRYEGFYVSHSSHTDTVHPFAKGERAKFVKAVRSAIPEPQRSDGYTAWTCAALAAVELLGDDYQRENGALAHRFPELAEAVSAAAEAWIEANL